MALRVLLGDESSTIKKVFQLALQDFAVEVRPVNIGVDVAAVAKAFKPDIIFADVLLQKKSGYDVCAELKQDPHLRQIPVVLMWSGFVDLDEDKFQASQANAQLEKPFDVTALRKLVSELVPRTNSQNLSEFLTFPKAMAEAERPSMLASATSVSSSANGGSGTRGSGSMSAEDFEHMPMSRKKPLGTAPGGSASDKYRLKMTAEELDPAHIAVDYELPDERTNLDKSVVLDKSMVIDKSMVLDKSMVIDRSTVRDKSIVLDKTQASAMFEKTGSISFEQPLVPEDGLDLPETEAEEFTVHESKKPTKTVPMPASLPTSGLVAGIVAGPGPEAAHPPPIGAASPPAPPPPIPALDAKHFEQIVRQQSVEMIESVIWKVVPELAKQIIERELEKLLKERDSLPY